MGRCQTGCEGGKTDGAAAMRELQPSDIAPDLEELLPDIQQCVTRYQAGRLESITAAVEGGQLLNLARRQLLHGDWLPYLEKVGLNRMTANRWMRLADLGLTPEEILERGGLRAVLAEAVNQARQPPRKPAQERHDEAYDEIGRLYKRISALQEERRAALRDGAVSPRGKGEM